MQSILSLRGYGVRFGKRKVLSDLNLDVGEKGVTHLLGPCGSGKSTLLRSLAGLNDKSSLFQSCGEVFYMGDPLGRRDHPVLLEQKPANLLVNVFDSIISNLPERSTLDQQQQRALVLRLLDTYGLNQLLDVLRKPLTQLPLVDRRLVLILGVVAAAPALIFLDEPTADLSDDEARSVLDLIEIVARNRAVMLVQHNQRLALQLGGRAVLMASGVLQEEGTTKDLLTVPRSVAGQEFMGSGTCAAPSLDTDPETLDEAFRDRYKPVVTKAAAVPEIIPFGPRGFRWISRDRLAATPRPGLLGEVDFDLKALAKVKIDWLVSLEEEKTVPEHSAQEMGIKIRHLPIQDMKTPDLESAGKLVAEMHQWLTEGKRLAVHCKAGLGRTGMIIAVYFVFIGLNPLEAIRKVRNSDPRMVQSEEQEHFIQEFYGWLREAG